MFAKKASSYLKLQNYFIIENRKQELQIFAQNGSLQALNMPLLCQSCVQNQCNVYSHRMWIVHKLHVQLTTNKCAAPKWEKRQHIRTLSITVKSLSAHTFAILLMYACLSSCIISVCTHIYCTYLYNYKYKGEWMRQCWQCIDLLAAFYEHIAVYIVLLARGSEVVAIDSI